MNIIIATIAMLLPAMVYIFPLVDGLTLIGSSSYFEVTRTTATINHSIVESSAPASSLIQCLSSGVNTLDVKSIYFDDDERLCYRNNQFDNPLDGDNNNGTIVYCEKKKSSDREADTIERRISVEGRNYKSCMEVKEDGFPNAGVYKMDGPIGIVTNYHTPCNLGWVVFQRRKDGSVDFFRDWDDYVNGFGNREEEFWLGLEAIHQLTAEGNCELYIYLKAEDDNPIQSKGYARYAHFQLGNSTSYYTLSVSGFSGNVWDSFSPHSGQAFSTRDVDNDNYIGSCANMYKGSWWYDECHAANLNGLYQHGAHASFADGIEWSGTWTQYYSLIEVEMRLRCN